MFEAPQLAINVVYWEDKNGDCARVFDPKLTKIPFIGTYTSFF